MCIVLYSWVVDAQCKYPPKAARNIPSKAYSNRTSLETYSREYYRYMKQERKRERRKQLIEINAEQAMQRMYVGFGGKEHGGLYRKARFSELRSLLSDRRARQAIFFSRNQRRLAGFRCYAANDCAPKSTQKFRPCMLTQRFRTIR